MDSIKILSKEEERAERRRLRYKRRDPGSERAGDYEILKLFTACLIVLLTLFMVRGGKWSSEEVRAALTADSDLSFGAEICAGVKEKTEELFETVREKIGWS